MLRRGSASHSECAGTEQSAKESEQSTTYVERDTDNSVLVEAEREAYEQKRVRDSAERIIHLYSHLYPLYAFTVLARWCLGHDTWYEFLCLEVPHALLIVGVKLYDVQQSPKSTTIALVFQSVFYVLVNIAISIGALSLSELKSHRLFLTCYLAWFAFFLIEVYIPGVYLLFCCCSSYAVWLQFHYAVDFMNFPIVIDGLLGTVFAYYILKKTQRLAWNEFKATQELDNERQFLQAMHDTLQGMLRSLFDASCTCDQSGALLSFTPQLRDLLGGHDTDGQTLRLHEFAASSVESDRLLQFLEQICQSGRHRAQTIQASLRAESQASGIREVTLFGIMLPDQPGEHGGKGKKRIFIGLQGQGSPASVVDACAVQPDEASLDTDTPDEASLDVLQIRMERLREEERLLEEDFGADVASLSYTKTHCSETATNVETVVSGFSKQQHSRHLLTTSSDASVQTTSDAAPILSNQLLQCPRCRLSQPEANSTPWQDSSAAWRDASVQTEGGDAQSNGLEGPRFPPPQPGTNLSREQACFKNWKANKPPASKVRLNSSKRVYSNFSETPDETLQSVLLEMVKTINARGRGCCSFHIIAARLSHVLTGLTSVDCPPDFSPFSDWQCHDCKSMNQGALAHQEGEDEPLCCSICGTEREGWQPSERSRKSSSSIDSGVNADLESLLSRRSSESRES